MNLGMPEMIFLFLLALLIFGPRKLPEIGRQVGKGLAEFKRATNDFQAQIADEVRRLDDEEKTIKAADTAAPEGAVAKGTLTDVDTPAPSTDEVIARLKAADERPEFGSISAGNFPGSKETPAPAAEPVKPTAVEPETGSNG